MMNSQAAVRRGPMPWLYIIAILALFIGLYARFKGLAVASMAADEYYIARSVQNVLRFGVPRFDCGGYYPRALAFQYLVALLAQMGIDPSSGARWVAAISSMVGLPAVYLLGRRAGGRSLGLVVLAILSLSVWEIEIARFGRMYAPFQTVFLWYLVFAVRLTIDREPRAMWPLLGLALLGAATWEGGAFLPLCNLLLLFVGNPRGRFDLRSIGFAALSVGLFVGAYMFLSANLRLVGEPQFPEGFDLDAARASTAASLGRTAAMWNSLSGNTPWSVMYLLPLGLALNALRWCWSLRERWPAAIGLALGLALALIHQFAAVAVLVMLLMLLGHLRREDLRSRLASYFWIAIAVSLVFWLAFGFVTGWHSGAQLSWLGHSRVAGILYEFVRLPDIVRQMAQPWFGATPILAVGGAVLLALALWRTLRLEQRWDTERLFVLLLLFMVSAVGATSPPREETRYVFFLYPLAIIAILAPLAELVDTAAARRGFGAFGFGALVMLILFCLTEDFQPRHLLRIDTPEALVRTDLPAHLETHVVPRTDVRGAAHWLAQASRDTSWLRVNAFPSADYYFADFDVAYLDRDGRRFRAYSCSRGTKERWGGLPLIYDIATLRGRISGAGGAFIVANARDAAWFIRALASTPSRTAWRSLDGEIEILALGGATSVAR